MDQARYVSASNGQKSILGGFRGFLPSPFINHLFYKKRRSRKNILGQVIRKNLLSRETVRVRMRVKVRDRIWWDEEEREGDGEGKKQLENEGQLVM